MPVRRSNQDTTETLPIAVMLRRSPPTPLSRQSSSPLYHTEDDPDSVFGVTLPTNILSKIFEHVGREGTFVFQIASGSRNIQSKSWFRENALREPFTYWDWAGVTQEEWGFEDDSFTAPAGGSSRTTYGSQENRRKRRLIWERQKSFLLNGGQWLNASSSRERWTRFKSIINDSNRQYVKRIAVSHWMTLEDLEWISEQLPALEALDLSDIDELRPSPMSHKVKEYGSSQNRYEGGPDWNLIVSSLGKTLNRIKWIGLQQEDGHTDIQSPRNSPFSVVLPACHSLRTLSVRGRHGYQPSHTLHDADPGVLHRVYCRQILDITDNIPSTVTTIEL